MRQIGQNRQKGGVYSMLWIVNDDREERHFFFCKEKKRKRYKMKKIKKWSQGSKKINYKKNTPEK